MKSLLLLMLLLAVLVFSNFTFAQPPDTLWTRTFGGADNEGCWGMSRTSNGDLLISGYTYSFGAGNCEGFVVRTNANGDTLWQHVYHDSPQWDDVVSCVERPGGGLFVVGQTVPDGSVEPDIIIRTTNASGDVLGTRTFGWPSTDWAHKAHLTSDGGLIIAGETARPARDDDFLVVRVDPQGDTLWTRSFGGIGREGTWGVQCAADGGFFVCGPTSSFGGGGNGWTTFVAKISAVGTILWSYDFDEISGYCSIDTLGNGCVVAARAFSDNTGLDLAVFNLDSAGNLLWTRTIASPGDQDPWEICRTQDGFVVVGSAVLPGSSNSDVYVARLNDSGDTLWTTAFGDQNDQIGRAVVVDRAGRILVGGLTTDIGTGMSDMLLIAISDPATVILPPIQDLTARPSSLSDMQLRWSPVTHTAGGQPISGVGYVIYGSSNPDGPFDSLAFSSTSSFLHPSILDTCSQYFYQVTATTDSMRH